MARACGVWRHRQHVCGTAGTQPSRGPQDWVRLSVHSLSFKVMAGSPSGDKSKLTDHHIRPLLKVVRNSHVCTLSQAAPTSKVLRACPRLTHSRQIAVSPCAPLGSATATCLIPRAEIAAAVTSANPRPVTLKMEKVYQPCILQTKKRYVGFAYETADQTEPVFDAKGIETIRCGGSAAVTVDPAVQCKHGVAVRDGC